MHVGTHTTFLLRFGEERNNFKLFLVKESYNVEGYDYTEADNG